MKQVGYQSRAQHLMPAANWDRSSGFPVLVSRILSHLKTLRMWKYSADFPRMPPAIKNWSICLMPGNGPQYLFCITAQNHGGYDTGLAVNSQLEILSPAGSYPCAQGIPAAFCKDRRRIR